MRARLVRQSTLADLARKLGINDFLILGEGELKSGGGERDSILSDAIEAVFGAVYLDGGFRNAKTIVLKLFADKLIEINTEDLKDNKTRLQEILQKKEKPLPVYDVLNQTGDAHDLTFEVKCEIEHPNSPFLAQGRSRRTAEQNAAKLAIKALSES
jgi:ribonuclease-3